MTRTQFIFGVATLALALNLGPLLRSAEDPTPPGREPIPQELRDQWKDLSPAERQAKIREFREKNPSGPLREEMEKRREMLKNLSPAERQAKLREWREKQGGRPPLREFSPEERRAKRSELRQRFERHHAQLMKKKADGNLSPAEKNRLRHMEELAKRFERGAMRPGDRRFPSNDPQGRAKPQAEPPGQTESSGSGTPRPTF